MKNLPPGITVRELIKLLERYQRAAESLHKRIETLYDQSERLACDIGDDIVLLRGKLKQKHKTKAPPASAG